jgi:hypothetical protein
MSDSCPVDELSSYIPISVLGALFVASELVGYIPEKYVKSSNVTQFLYDVLMRIARKQPMGKEVPSTPTIEAPSA